MRQLSAERIHNYDERSSYYYRERRHRCGTGRARRAGEGLLEERRQPQNIQRYAANVKGRPFVVLRREEIHSHLESGSFVEPSETALTFASGCEGENQRAVTERNLQKRTFSASCPIRGSSAERMLPKPAPLTELLGLLKLARLKKLKNSARI
jgi:hypothetical protein